MLEITVVFIWNVLNIYAFSKKNMLHIAYSRVKGTDLFVWGDIGEKELKLFSQKYIKNVPFKCYFVYVLLRFPKICL